MMSSRTKSGGHMPAPKDPKKYAEWKKRIAEGLRKSNALRHELGIPPVNAGRKQSPEEVARRAAAIRQTYIDNPEKRENLSRIAKENGYGKWMEGRSAPGVSKANKRRKGKTYEELYGDDAAEEKLKRKVGNVLRMVGKVRRQRNRHNGDMRYKRWRDAVYQRDNYTCQKCQTRGGYLNAHHIKSWAKYKKLRYVVANGITYCESCHKEEHAA